MAVRVGQIVGWGVVALACGSEPGAATTGGPGPQGTAGGSTSLTPGQDSGGSAGLTAGSSGAAGSGSMAAGAAGVANAGTGNGGSGSTTLTAGAGGSSGDAQGGNAGAAGASGGSGGSGGANPNEDQMPWREMMVTAQADLYQFGFQPSDADPMAVQQNGSQVAALDTRAPTLAKKLVVDIGFNRGEYDPWVTARGFHFLAVDFLGVDEYEIVRGDADFYGDARLEALEGVNHTDDPDVDINYHDSMEGHVTEGLKYLRTQLPDQDWGYYLNEDDTVRWSDVIMTGLSHGASSVARWGMVRRLWRVVSKSGPRDNTCGTDPNCAMGVAATWFSETPATPLDRFYSISGTMDPQYPEILYAMEQIGYVGEPVDVGQTAAPYGGSHRLFANAGHEAFCGGAQYDDACNYMFGVLPENQ